jgi:hypothetical protein
MVQSDSMSFAEIAVELRGMSSALRAAIVETPDRGPDDQAVVDAALANVYGIASRKRHGIPNIPRMVNIKCQGCGVVMPEVFADAWIEKKPGEYESFCLDCRQKRGL